MLWSKREWTRSTKIVRTAVSISPNSKPPYLFQRWLTTSWNRFHYHLKPQLSTFAKCTNAEVEERSEVTPFTVTKTLAYGMNIFKLVVCHVVHDKRKHPYHVQKVKTFAHIKLSRLTKFCVVDTGRWKITTHDFLH